MVGAGRLIYFYASALSACPTVACIPVFDKGAGTVRFVELCSVARYFAHNNARYKFDMLSYGYDIHWLLRLVSRFAPNFSWRYGVEGRVLVALVHAHLRITVHERVQHQ